MSKWSDGAKILQKLISAKELIPVQSDLINLQQTMFSLQNDQMKLVDENSTLKDEVSELKIKLKQKQSVIPEKNHEWLILQNDLDEARRYCPICFYDRDKLIPLSLPEQWNSKLRRTCDKCVKHFN